MMNNYTPPYKITSKILKLSTKISEELTKLQFNSVEKVNPMLRKKNRIKKLERSCRSESDYKSDQKSDQKVLTLMKENSNITIKEMMETLNMSESGVKKVIKKLKDENRLLRVGSLKAGNWEIKQ